MSSLDINCKINVDNLAKRRMQMTCKKISKDTISLKKEKCKKKCRKCGKVQKTLEGGYNCSIIFSSNLKEEKG